MKQTFLPNSCNCGGRNQITQQMYNHRQALLNTKSAINSKVPPKSHVLSKKKKVTTNPNKINDYNQVFKTFKAVSECKKGLIDNAIPKGMEIKKARPASSKQDKFFLQEHQRNLNAQNARLNQIGKSMNERRKNKFDPIAYPAFFFRKKNEGIDKINCDDFLQQSAQRTIAVPVEKSGLKKKIDNQSKQYKTMRMQPASYNQQQEKSMHQKPQLTQQKKNELLQDFDILTVKIPEGNPKESEEVQLSSLKREIILGIIEYRIYKEKDLKEYFDKIKLYNTHLEKESLQLMFDEIKFELDN